MRILLLVIMVWSVHAAPLLRRSLTVESLEIEMQFETMTDAEKTEQIHLALGHDHHADSAGRTGALDEVLKTGSYPKPVDHKADRETKTAKELITQYIEAEPSDKPLGGHPYLSKGSNQNLNGTLQQQSTLGVQGWKNKAENNNDKKKKDDADNDDDDDKASTRNNSSSFVVPTPTPVSISPTAEEGFVAQGGAPTEASVVTKSLPNAAFLYKRSSFEAPSLLDLSRLTFITNSLFLEMFTKVFSTIVSAGFISVEISSFTELRKDFVNFKVNVYFDGRSETVPDVKQLLEIAHEELNPGSVHYDQYLTRLQESESPVLSSTDEVRFISSQNEIDSILADKPYAPVTESPAVDKQTDNEEEKTNHMLPIILLGCILVAAVGWFSYRRRINMKRPMLSHNLMKMKGDRDDSTVATYRTTVYTEEALKKKVSGTDKLSTKAPTMEELEEVSDGDSSDASSSEPSLSPPNSPGATSTAQKAIRKHDLSLKKPSWASRSVTNSERSDESAFNTPVFSTPVSVADAQSEATALAPSMEPITYDFVDKPRGRISRKKYTKASTRVVGEGCSDTCELKLSQRPVVANSSRAAKEPSLSIPDLRMKDLMAETNMDGYLSLRAVGSNDDSSVDVIVTDESMEPSYDLETFRKDNSALAVDAETEIENGLVGNDGPIASNPPDEKANEGQTEISNQNDEVIDVKKPTENRHSSQTKEVKDRMDTTKSGPDSGFPTSRYIVADKDLPEWMRRFKEMGLSQVNE